MRLPYSLVFILLSTTASSQTYRVSTIAGFGTFGGDGGPATAALLNPSAVAVAADGTVYVADPGNYRIRKIDPSGVIHTLIGTGYDSFSGDGGPASAAGISAVYGLALDTAGNLYFTDGANLRIREVTAGGSVKTIAGNGTCGAVTAGMAAAAAPLCDVESVAVDGQGQVFFASTSQVWRVAADGTLVLIAGNGQYGSAGDGGLATSAQLEYPGSLAIDPNGNLYAADSVAVTIREVTADKRISTVYKQGGNNSTTLAIALDKTGTVFFVTGETQVYKLVAGTPVTVASLTRPDTADFLAIDQNGSLYATSVTTLRVFKLIGGNNPIAGAYPYGIDPLPQPALNVRLHMNPLLIGLAVDAAGNVYFPELDGNLVQRIDKVTPGGTMSAVNAPATLPTGGNFTVQAVAFSPSGSLYFSTFTQVYRLEAGGSVTLIAGAPGFPTNVGDGGQATLAQITNPSDLDFDPSGNLYIAEPFSSRVRKVTPGGIITTFAGTGVAGYSGDNGPAAVAKLSTPVDVKADRNGNVFIADLTASVVRKVDTHGTITTVAGNGAKGFSGDGGPAVAAMLSGAAAIAVDPSGNLFIVDQSSAASTISPATSNNRIRMVNPAGIITTIFGGPQGYNGENVVSTSAAAGGPVALAADAQGNLYVLEAGTQRIRKLTVQGGAPAVGGGTPASGSGATHSFAFQFSDPAGYQALGVVNVLINNFLDGRNACYLAYAVQSTTLYLVNDAGQAGGPYAGSVGLGSSTPLQNSQCAVTLVSAVGSGTTLTLNLNITFSGGFAGNRIVYVAARDQGQGNTDWQPLGVWQPSSAAPGSISVTSVTPPRGATPAGTAQIFTVVLTDTRGSGDLGVVNLLINRFIDGRQACYLAFVPSSNTLLLVDDAGDAGGPFAGSLVVNGGAGSIENSQCAVSNTGSGAGLAGNTLTLTLNITFKGAFAGNRVMYVAGRDRADGNNTDWQAMGTWTVQ